MQPQKLRTEESTSKLNSPYLLYHGIKSLLRCDEAEVVSGIARYVVSQHFGLRIFAWLAEWGRGGHVPGMITLIGWLRSFLAIQDVEQRGGTVWIARLGNERGVIERQLAMVPELNCMEMKFHWLPDRAGLSALFRSSGPRRALRLARLIHRRYEFFKVLRVIELLGFYARYCQFFKAGRFSLAVMSSHSNPHGIAFNLAARKHGVPVVLITHGMPVRPVAPLSFELAVVHCEAARQTYLADGCHMDMALIHGRRQDHGRMSCKPLSEPLAVGIFLCKDVNENRLRNLVSQLLGDQRVAKVMIRPHPKNLWRGLDDWITSEENTRLIRGGGNQVVDDLKAVDVVLAGNSSVLVDAVTAGQPSAYVPGLDYGARDMHEFVSTGLIYNLNEDAAFDPETLFQFYQRANWTTVLRRFADIDVEASEVELRVASALRKLAIQNQQTNLRT